MNFSTSKKNHEEKISTLVLTQPTKCPSTSLRLSPVGVLFLVASKILEMKDLALIAGQVGLYSATVLAGVLIHGFVVLPLLYFLLVRKNPYSFLLRMGQAMATAFGTSSR